MELAETFSEELLSPMDLKATEQTHPYNLLARGSDIISRCTDGLLLPSSMLTRGASYARMIKKWQNKFGRSSVHVTNVDDFKGHEARPGPQHAMDEIFTFLGLAPADVTASSSQYCVRGRNGVIETMGSDRAKLEDASEPHEGIGECDNAEEHDLAPDLEARLQRYFEPFNQHLYKLLGRNLGW